MRQMKDIKEPTVISAYMNLMLLSIMLVIVYATGSDLTPWQKFGWLEWVCLFTLSISNVGSQTFRFMAS